VGAEIAENISTARCGYEIVFSMVGTFLKIVFWLDGGRTVEKLPQASEGKKWVPLPSSGFGAAAQAGNWAGELPKIY